MRMERVEWFADRDPLLPEIEELLDLGIFLPLKVKDDQNRQVFIIREYQLHLILLRYLVSAIIFIFIVTKRNCCTRSKDPYTKQRPEGNRRLNNLK